MHWKYGAIGLLVSTLWFLVAWFWMITDDFSGYDHYEVLGISTSASLRDITQAYRQLSLKHHPDKSDSNKSVVRFHHISGNKNRVVLFK